MEENAVYLQRIQMIGEELGQHEMRKSTDGNAVLSCYWRVGQRYNNYRRKSNKGSGVLGFQGSIVTVPL
jgi:hypothetical protein